MFRYEPPKSNCWGHSLRKMEPARQDALFNEFLKRVSATHSYTGGSLHLLVGPAPTHLSLELQDFFGHVTTEDVQRLEQLLGFSPQKGSFGSLTHQQFDVVLKHIIKNNNILKGVSLDKNISISKWIINGNSIETKSEFGLSFGLMPYISTRLEFQTLDQFKYINNVLSNLKLCKLNEKHLKPIKRGLKKKVDK